MSESTQGSETGATPAKGYQAGLVVTYPLPDEVAVPLRKDQFEILCEGGVGEARASRDLCLGVFLGSIVGLFGILATTDDTVWKPERRGRFLFWLAFLFLIVSGSAVGTCIHWVRLRRTSTDSLYSRLRKRLQDMFDGQS